MADKALDLKIEIDPFQEVGRDLARAYCDKEFGIRPPGQLKYTAKVVPGSPKWDKRRAEEAIRAFFRYDLKLFATQTAKSYELIEKAKNGQDRQKRIKSFGAALKRNLAALDTALARKFADAQEDIEEGATDDAAVVKDLRKSAQAAEVRAMMTALKSFHQRAAIEVKRIEKAKAKGREAADGIAGQAAALASELQRESASVQKVNKDGIRELAKLPEIMTKGAKKDVSETTALTLKRSLGEFRSVLKLLASELKKAQAGREKAIAKIRRGDFGPGTLDLVPKPDGSLGRTLLKVDGILAALGKELAGLEKNRKKK